MRRVTCTTRHKRRSHQVLVQYVWHTYYINSPQIPALVLESSPVLRTDIRNSGEIRSRWNQRIDACALCLFQFSASTGSARATIRRSATFSHFLREGTSCGGVGARCAPLSRLRAGRVCGWVDQCWIVIWWYFSVLDRRLLCELRGGTVPRGPYARVSKFDIVQVFLGRSAFQWKHEGMASEPRFIR